MGKRKYTLEQILGYVKVNGPKSIKDLGCRLSIDEARSLSLEFQQDGLNVKPYDFPGTCYVWSAENEEGVLYKHEATKILLENLAKSKNVDCTTPGGFKIILSEIGGALFKNPINDFGTILEIMLRTMYDGSPFNAISDLIESDKDFVKIKKIGFSPYDLPKSPSGTWKKSGKPSPLAREATKKLLEQLVIDLKSETELDIDITTVLGFKKILPYLSRKIFNHKPVNYWGTKLCGMFSNAYNCSTYAAVIDLINHDPIFNKIRNEGLCPYDFPSSPNNYWVDSSGSSTKMAREVTKIVIMNLAKREGVDYKSIDGFKKLIPSMSESLFYQPINIWGTTFEGMLQTAYQKSTARAVIDLVENDDDFSLISDIGLKFYDFNSRSIWTNEGGLPSDLARESTKTLIQVIAKKEEVDWKSVDGFARILPLLTRDVFQREPINVWGTTLGGMYAQAYGSSRSKAILDVVENDDDFLAIRGVGLQSYDISKRNDWFDESGNPNDLARHAVKTLVLKLAREENVNCYSWRGFKKILPKMDRVTFSKPINPFGTTIKNMLCNYYNDSITRAITDLIENDDDFSSVKKHFHPSMLKDYAVSAKLRSEGIYSPYLLRQRLSEEGLDLRDLGFYSFADGEKQVVREIMAEVVAKKFGEKKISYCGLEGPSFGSYFTFAKQTLIDSRKSLIPERNKKNYNLMRRITQMNSVNSLLNGSSLWSINLVNSTLKEALDKSDQEFDFIYIDRLGHLCSSYIDELALAYDHLIDNGLIAATVRVDPLAENRFQRTLETNLSQDEFLCGWSNDRGYKLSKLSYVGGDKITIPMKVYLFNT